MTESGRDRLTTFRHLARAAWLHVGPWGVPTRTHTGDDARVIISLTSLPSRLRHIGPTLRSLAFQDRPADELIVVLPARSTREGCAYDLRSLPRRSGATVLRTRRDWGPATKLLPVLEKERGQDVLIVVVDDDTIYPPDLVSTFVAWHRKRPDAALGWRGWRVPPTLRWGESPALRGATLGQPESVDVLTACWGVAVQPRFFTGAVFDYSSAPPSAFFVDDVWFSGHLARQGVERLVVPGRHAPLSTLTTRINALCRQENADGRHNDCMLREFADAWTAR